MDNCNILELLEQFLLGEAGAILRDFLRGGFRQMFTEVMAEEVTALCGPKHKPIEGSYVRSGSSSGRVLIDGPREDVIRPRVRQRGESGSSSELSASIIQALASGVSTRQVKHVKP